MSDLSLDDLPDGVVAADAAGTVTVVNAAARELLGAAAEPGRTLPQVLTLVDTEGRDWCSANDPYGGLGTRTGVPEQTWLGPDGNEVLVNARVFRDRPGAPVRRVVVALRNGRGRARLDRERSDLVATVAHELRSPLTGVKGFVQVLLNRWDQLNDDQKKLMLTTVGSDADRLTRLIAELLDVARIDTGRLSLFPRPVDAAELVGRVVDSSRAATSRVIAWEPPAEPVHVLADPDKFLQVLSNLVENAVKHGAGTVTVALGSASSPAAAGSRPAARGGGEESAAGDAVVVTVRDEGEGIAPDLRRRVVTKFWSQGGSGGSGLGLYIVNGLVRAHGGRLEIGETDTGGALVRVTWPAPAPDEVV